MGVVKTPGTSALTVEQQQWFADNLGVRYHHVQTRPEVPNRKTRRQLARTRGYGPDPSVTGERAFAWGNDL